MKLANKKVVLLVEELYNEFEVWIPYYRLIEEGAEVTIVGSGTSAEYKGKFGIPIMTDKDADAVSMADYDAVIIPGGYAPDKMRIHPAMVDLVKQAMETNKVVASICHGGWMLCSADVLKGRRVTSYIAIRDDMVNAGALWEDSEMVKDGNLITSRKPDDLPAFCRTIVETMSEA